MQIRILQLILLFAAPLVLTGCKAARYETSTDYHATYQQPAANSRIAHQKHQKAISALEAGELAKAEALCKEVLVTDRRFGAAHNTLGTVYFQQGHNYQAAWEFQYARQKLPKRPEPHNNLGMVFERTQKYENAIFHYLQAITIEPSNPEYLGNLVRLKIKLGDRSARVQQELQALLEIEHRPEWSRWARDQLALKHFSDPYGQSPIQFEHVAPWQPSILPEGSQPILSEPTIIDELQIDGLLDQIPRTSPSLLAPTQPDLPVNDSFGDTKNDRSTAPRVEEQWH